MAPVGRASARQFRKFAQLTHTKKRICEKCAFFQCKIHLRSKFCRRKRRPTCKSLTLVGRVSARYGVIKDIYGLKRRLTGKDFTPAGRALARQRAKLSTRLMKRRNK